MRRHTADCCGGIKLLVDADLMRCVCHNCPSKLRKVKTNSHKTNNVLQCERGGCAVKNTYRISISCQHLIARPASCWKTLELNFLSKK